MRRNSGWASVPGGAVGELVSSVATRMVVRHPFFTVSVVDSVVQQAASELVSTVTEAGQLARLLERRGIAPGDERRGGQSGERHVPGPDER